MALLNTIEADLTAAPVGDSSQTDRLLALMTGQARYVCEEWLPPRIGAGIPESTRPPDDYFGDGAIGAARDLASAAVALAVGVGTDRLGVTSEAARAQAIRAIDLVAARHKVSAGATGWGRSWQGPLVSGQVGLAAWLLWDELNTTTQRRTAALIVDEANLLTGEGVYYYRDVGGAVIRPGLDTGSEEESWRARGLSIAVAMLPTHHQRVRWERNLLTRQLASYSRPADVGSKRRGAPGTKVLVAGRLEHGAQRRPAEPRGEPAPQLHAAAEHLRRHGPAGHGRPTDQLRHRLPRSRRPVLGAAAADDDGTHAYPPEFPRCRSPSTPPLRPPSTRTRSSTASTAASTPTTRPTWRSATAPTPSRRGIPSAA
ncbi:hypothetical protein BH20ACT2_BH20ACT2_18230 [soil metagenome]